MPPTAPPLRTPRLEGVSVHDVEAIAPAGGGWEGGLVQLDRGPLHYGCRRLVLPGVQVLWHAVDRRVHGRWHHRTDALEFFCLLDADAPLRYRGRDLRPDQLMVFLSEREHEYVMPRVALGLEVRIAPTLARFLAWPRPLTPTPCARPEQLRALEEVCRAATREGGRPPAPESGARHALALRDRVLDAVADVLRPGPERPRANHPARRGGERSFALTRRAVRRMREMGNEVRVRIGALACELGVPERTLYQAFRNTFGMGPYEFDRLERLHAFRTVLGSGPAFHGKVARAARKVGFHDASRLTQAYRQQFGETPRGSLKRWAATSVPPFGSHLSRPGR